MLPSRACGHFTISLREVCSALDMGPNIIPIRFLPQRLLVFDGGLLYIR